ncbi:MAG: hypothetical protein JSV17_13120 [Candidatus Aminicenantes bacterium]|nr:MAG: hypothetical protein JSV17_13120 [Candidatus Aminicenantes bacterium]
MTRLPLAIFVILMIFSVLLAFQKQPSTEFDYKSAEAMMKVIQALHRQDEEEVIQKLLDEALKFEAYEVSHERYTDPERSKENQVTLSQFRRFMLSLSGDQVDTQDNRRLMITQPFYEDAIKNPEKFQKAIQKIQSTPSSQFQDSFDLALYWLPEKPDLNIHVWVLFDIGGSGAWAFRTKDGAHNIGFNLLHMLNDKGEFDLELFLGILAHEIHHLGEPQSHYLEAINYDSLRETSRLRLYSDYVIPFVTEGMAQKFCNNAPGTLTPKPYPEKVFSATSLNLKDWTYFQKQFIDIHNRAIKDLRQLLGSTSIDKTRFDEEYGKYWTWRAGEFEGKNFTLGRRYYYGTELMGVINDAFGRDVLFEGLKDLRKIPLLFNEGVKKLHPKDFEPYLFPEDLITLVQELY